MNRGQCVSVLIHVGGAFSFQLQVDYAQTGMMKSELTADCYTEQSSVDPQKWKCTLHTLWCRGGLEDFEPELKAWTTEVRTESWNTNFFSYSLSAPLSAAAFVSLRHRKAHVPQHRQQHWGTHRVICVCTEAEENRSNSSTFISISGTEKIQIWRREEAELSVFSLLLIWSGSTEQWGRNTLVRSAHRCRFKSSMAQRGKTVVIRFFCLLRFVFSYKLLLRVELRVLQHRPENCCHQTDSFHSTSQLLVDVNKDVNILETLLFKTHSMLNLFPPSCVEYWFKPLPPPLPACSSPLVPLFRVSSPAGRNWIRPACNCPRFAT